MIRDLVLARFAASFEGPATARVIRTPGRVNLIGEHIDYCGLPVLPMAIQRGITIALRPRTDRTVRLGNLDPRFPERTFVLSRDIAPLSSGDWGNYLQAAGQALVRRCGDLAGFDAIVGSDLPVAAGLSSSSALVVAVALALLAANDTRLEPLELAALLAQAERYVGTAGGGMDQAIALGARAGHAARIEFDPVRLTYVAVPRDWRFLVASSLVPAEKSGPAQRAYNARTHETTAARELVSRYMHVPGATSYADLFAARPVDELLGAAAKLEPLLRRRYRHVVSEGARVREAERAMATGDLARFAALMDASHASLRDDYEVSSAALDRLVETAHDAGAAGARLTGAGFGGCIVALAEAGTVEQVLQGMRERFYYRRDVRDTTDALFVAVPSGAAGDDVPAI
jgi:galactokinase